MAKVEKMLEDGYALIFYPNRLGSATMVLVDGEDWEAVQDVIDGIPDERVIDVRRPTSVDTIEAGVAQIKRKINREGEYENWDEKMRSFGLPNASERPTKPQKG